MKYLILPLIVLMAGCGGSAEEISNEEEGSAGVDRSMMQRLDLSEHSMPFSLWVPSKDHSNTDPLAEFDDSFMHVSVKAGKRFQLIIRQEPAGMERLKMALENDILREHEYLTDEPHLLIYKSTYPDQEKAYVHFYYAFEVNGEPYVAEDVKEGEFNEANIQMMLGSLQDLELPV